MHCGLAFGIAATIVAMPAIDSDGRRKTLNGRGFGDTKLNATQELFIAHSIRETTVPTLPPGTLVPAVIDAGGGFGDVSFKILNQGGNVVYIDMEDQHQELVQAVYQRLLPSLHQAFPSGAKLEALVGQLPLPSDRYLKLGSLLFSNLMRVQRTYAIRAMGSFSMMMYLSPGETTAFLDWAYETLQPGGRLYITGVSPFCNLFPGYEPTYLARLAEFRRDPQAMPFPGWIPDVTKLTNLPANYLDNYTRHFHFIDPEVIAYHAHNRGFEMLPSPHHIGRGFLRRDFPQRLIYQGQEADVGELASIILVKP